MLLKKLALADDMFLHAHLRDQPPLFALWSPGNASVWLSSGYLIPLLQVHSRSTKPIRVIAEKAEPALTGAAQDTAYLPGLVVVMIQLCRRWDANRRIARTERLTTNGTRPSLLVVESTAFLYGAFIAQQSVPLPLCLPLRMITTRHSHHLPGKTLALRSSTVKLNLPWPAAAA
jgi:hypothetical protein